ncbi:tetratricopeptide repeat protein [Streptomyces sp. NRRL S-37]|uniref:tetratricopeptide repeat protein n=1 Tax=Streptomyces sp. NRRL S-37 TaxID=1463903 RepID=UPI0004C5B357|nr:tetratricopeptide repeat protein [Streptomyces sp. NRRL S-37]
MNDARRSDPVYNYVGGDVHGINIQGSTLENLTLQHFTIVRRETPPPPTQLPPAPDHFIGREAELSRLKDLAAEAADRPVVVTVEGAAGVGKTGLSLHAAHELARHFPGGQLYADLRSYAVGGRAGAVGVSPGKVLGDFLKALDVAEEDMPVELDSRAATFRSHMAGRKIVIVLDNAADPALVRPLLPGQPGCLMLVTSRSNLSGLDPTERIHLRTLSAVEAEDLLASLIGSERAAVERSLIGELGRLCGHLPLALRIAAARLRSRPSWPVGRMVDAMAQERHRLAELKVADVEIRAAFALSYQMLPDAQARIFRLTSLHPGPDLTPALAAAAVGCALKEAEEVLEALLDANLLEQEEVDRYRFHDLLRLFAREEAGAVHGRGEINEVQERLADYFIIEGNVHGTVLSTYQRSPEATSNRPAALRWFDAEFPNYRAVLDMVADKNWHERTLDLIAPLTEFLELRGWLDHDEAVAGLRLAVAQQIDDRTGKMYALSSVAYVLQKRGQLDRAREMYEEALNVAVGLEDPSHEAGVLNNLGTFHMDSGEFEQAARTFERAAEISVRGRDYALQLKVLHNSASACAFQEKWDEAIAAYELAEILADWFDPTELPDIWQSMAKVALERGGDPEDALPYAQRALDMRSELDDRPGQVDSLLDIGRIHLAREDADAVQDCARRAMDVARSNDDRRAEALGLELLAAGAELRGDRGEARTAFRSELEIFLEAGEVAGSVRSSQNLVMLLLQDELLDDAVEVMTQVTDFLELTGDLAACAGAAMTFAARLNGSGGREGAVEWYGRAADAYRSCGDLAGERDACYFTGQLLQALQRPEEAVPWYERAVDGTEEAGSAVEPYMVLANLGAAYKNCGRSAEAVDAYRRSIELGTMGDGMDRKGEVLSGLGAAHIVCGEFDRAGEVLADAVSWYEETGEEEGLARGLTDLTQALVRGGRLKEAGEVFTRARELWVRLEKWHELAEVHQMAGVWSMSSGYADDAARFLDQALALYQQLDDAHEQARTHEMLGLAYRIMKKDRKSRRHYRRGISIFQNLGNASQAQRLQRELAEVES